MDNEHTENNEALSQDSMMFEKPFHEEIHFDNPPKLDESSSADIMPETLPEAIRYVVEKWGEDYLQERGFINILNDFKVLKDMPAAKHILQNMQINGYVDMFLKTSNWELDSKNITKKYTNEYGANESIVGYVVQCIGYGLNKKTDIPISIEELKQESSSFSNPFTQTIDFPKQTAPSQPAPTQPKIQPQVQPQNLGPYNPKDDLPNYQYPTLDLMEDHSGADIVSIKSVLQSDEFHNTSMELPVAIGKKEDGSPLIFDLAEAPHLMISGASGMGVSVCFNTIITSLLYKKHPAEMKFVSIDPKKIEFSLYSPLEKYFLAALPRKEAVVTDMSTVSDVFISLNKELDTRLELFKKASVRDIKSYNRRFCDRKLSPSLGHKYMPYIVVLIDEYDELVRCTGTIVGQSLESISRIGKSIGIHLVISVQRPVATVISAGIKTNIPSRISFRVTSSNDSRNILGISGAEKLLRPGDMIYTNGIDLFKSRCAYIDLTEIDRINDFISNQQGYISVFELPDPDYEEPEKRDVDMQHLDPMFEDAARLIVREQLGSTSLVQRKFALGYHRAGRLLDQLEKAGIVGAAHGSKPREVIIKDENSLENILAQWR